MGILETYFSVDQVASQLGLHPKTVRHYIRSGRLRATKVGKQFRISRDDLAALLGAEKPGPEARTLRVSAVVELPRSNADEAAYFSSALLAALKGKDPSFGAGKAEVVYDPADGSMRIILFGRTRLVREMIDMIDTLKGKIDEEGAHL